MQHTDLEFLTLDSISTVMPVALGDIKASIGTQYYQDDNRIRLLIASAVDYLENTYNICILTQQWTQTAHNIQGRFIEYQYLTIPFGATQLRGHSMHLMRYPVQSLDAVSYYDDTDTLQTYATSNFYFMKSQRYLSYVRLANDIILPTTEDRPDAWQFTYTCGFTSTLNANQSVSTNCPVGIQRAIHVLVSTLNEYREEEISGSTIAKCGFTVDRLMSPYVFTTAL